MQPLYDSIGSTYSATRRADPLIARELARLVDAKDGCRFLDVACGTGNYTCALASFGGQWHGTDISEIMLKQAAAKTSEIEWRVSSADALPYNDGFFKGVVCSLAIHHFPELAPSFREVWRVLEKGHYVIFTAFPEQMRRYWLCHYFPEMMQRSAKNMPTKDSVTRALHSVGFEIASIIPFHVTNELQDLFLYSGKERPEFYFDTVVRANISSFASLCAPEELDAGLRALRADLNAEHFQNIAQRYSSAGGDYAYIVARKHAAG